MDALLLQLATKDRQTAERRADEAAHRLELAKEYERRLASELLDEPQDDEAV